VAQEHPEVVGEDPTRDRLAGRLEPALVAVRDPNESTIGQAVEHPDVVGPPVAIADDTDADHETGLPSDFAGRKQARIPVE
jgi:hypothetical protein